MKEIIIKNIFLHILLVIFYYFSKFEIASINASNLETLVLFVGLIVIAPITSNFVYSYKNNISRIGNIRGHISTFSSMLVIGILFIILDLLLLRMIGAVVSFRLAIIIFWIAVVTFDFADIQE